MQIVDTHCHLDEESLAHEIETVVAFSVESGVVAMVTIGTSVESSRRAIELADRFPGVVFAAVGIHPNYTAAAKSGDWEIIEELARHPCVVAVGETGLDRYWDYAPINLQQDYFDRHLKLSDQIGKPFIVHCRDADEETRTQLRAAAEGGQQLRGVMHSFCQSAESAAELLSLGMFVSFTGMLTFKRNQELRNLAASLPTNRLFVETDAPYLAPMPNRGKRNEPAFTRFTLECLAECHSVSPEEMARQTTENACGFFGIELPGR